MNLFTNHLYELTKIKIDKLVNNLNEAIKDAIGLSISFNNISSYMWPGFMIECKEAQKIDIKADKNMKKLWTMESWEVSCEAMNFNGKISKKIIRKSYQLETKSACKSSPQIWKCCIWIQNKQ